MMRCRFAALAVLAAMTAPARAAPPSPPAATAQPDGLKAPFEALPEPDRRALQAALIWTADFAGAVTGGYGPRTHDALLAYARRIGAPPEAALDPATRARLLADAEAARRAVGFTVLRDARTGIAIGVPARLAPARSTLADGTRYAAADGGFAIELTGRAGAGPDGLADALARLTREAPGRRVTYKLSKPDFVVVSGETGDAAFYARMALAPSAPPGGKAALRGFVLIHPRTDRSNAVALAVAASFDPFPAPAPAPASAAGAAPPAAVLVGQAVLVGPGLALARLDRSRCAEAEVGGAPARWTRQDGASGLALLSLPGHADAAPIPMSGGADGPSLALFLVPGEGVSPGLGAPALSAAGVVRDGDGGTRVPLQGADSGAVLLDGAGALAGLTGPRGGKPVSVAGVVAETRYGVAEAGPIAAFLKDAAVPTAATAGPLAPGEAVARWRPAILPLRCRAG